MSDDMNRYDSHTDKFLKDTQYNILGADLAEVGTDCISRQAAIKATWQDTGYTDPFNVMTAIRDKIKQLPPAQLAPDNNGDLWVTVPDIDEVTCIYVQESKSKFCRIFYEEQEQPERIRGRWIEHDDGLVACECSVCHEKYNLYEEDVSERNYCPNCGADMREVTT